MGRCVAITTRIGIGSTISKRLTYLHGHLLLPHMFLWSPRRLQCPTGILCQQYPQRWPERRRNWSDATPLGSGKQALSDSDWLIDNHVENPLLGFANGMVTWLDQMLSLKNTHQGKEPEKRRQGRQSKKWTSSIAKWRGKSFSSTRALFHDSLRCSAAQRSYNQPKLRDSDTKDRNAGTRWLRHLSGFQKKMEIQNLVSHRGIHIPINATWN